jgi:hypothetical protein
MKVRSKLADIEFQFGHFEYKKDHLIVHSHPDQAMQSKVYISPNDILSAFGRALSNPMVWVFSHLDRDERRSHLSGYR